MLKAIAINTEKTEIGHHDFKSDVCLQLGVHGNPRQAVLYAYLAGIIDGEGTIRINKTNYSQKRMVSPQYLAHLCLGMVDKQIPDLLKETFGGNVREERVPNRRSIWRWELTGRFQVPKVLISIFPYLIVKKRHAEVAIDFCQKWVRPRVSMYGVDPKELQRREEAYQKIRKLNAVGAAATTERVGIREDEATV
uniref:Putative HNH homing endonuclease n=1 Tax=viral metagenome TaxID=1070528 RepID=A0A6H1ZMJ5_9ZZZZ